MQGHEHQGRRPPGPFKHRRLQHAQAPGPQQQPAHQADHHHRHRQAEADRQVDRQVVGVAMPMARAQGVDQAEGRRPPAQPGPLANQACGHGPLAQAGDRQGPVAGEVEIAEAHPDRFGHHNPGPVLEICRHHRQAGQGHGPDRYEQQGQQPEPASRPHHDRQGQHQGPPGVARIGEIEAGHQGGGQQQGQGPPLPGQGPLQQGRQAEGPDQGQPGSGDVGVVEQAREPAGGIAPRGDPPGDQATEQLPGAGPAQVELAQARHNHRHRAGQKPQPRPAPGPGRGHVGLEAPEAPEKGQPVAQAHPGQPAAGGPEAAHQHQHRDRQQPAVAAIAPPGRPPATALHQGGEQEHGAEEGTGGQQEHPQLEPAPAEPIGPLGAFALQVALELLAEARQAAGQGGERHQLNQKPPCGPDTPSPGV